MAKIKDIAEKTGFSITTVSRVLNQDKSFNVSDETRLKIMSTAEELNYKTLSQRNKPAKVKNQTVGLIYWYSVSEELTDPYYLAIRLAVENYFSEKGIKLKKIYLPDKSTEELKAMDLDGIIAVGKYSRQEIKNLKSISPHMVLVDCYTKDYEIDVVKVNIEEATEDAIRHINESAQIMSIGYIGGIESTLDGEVLKDGRMQAFKSLMRLNEHQIHLGSFTADSGYELMLEIIKNEKLQPAYVVGSDAMAMGVLKALNEHQITVPRDVSIVSFDNIALSQYTIPALTTIDMNPTLMGETAAALLAERLETGRSTAKKVFIPTKLIKRGSTHS